METNKALALCGAAFAIMAVAGCKTALPVYEASSDLGMDARPGADAPAIDPELANSRLSKWRSREVVARAVRQYRVNHPASQFQDSEIQSALENASLELQPGSGIVTVKVRSGRPEFAAALANAYADAIASFTDDEDKTRCDEAASRIHKDVLEKRRDLEKIAKRLQDFRVVNKLDNLRSSRDINRQALQKTTTDILNLERDEARLIEWENLLTAAKKTNGISSALPVDIPGAEEIAAKYRAFQAASDEYDKLKLVHSEHHPEVTAKAKALEFARIRFVDATKRALMTVRSSLQVARNQLGSLRQRQEDFRNDLSSLEQRIETAESTLTQLEAEFGDAERDLERLVFEENKIRIEAERNNKPVRVVRHAGD